MSLANIADRLVGEEMLTRRVKRPEARKIIAREAGITPGSLESLGRGRLKFHERIASKLHVLLVKKLEERMYSLQHELEIAKALVDSNPVDIGRAEAALAELKDALGK